MYGWISCKPTHLYTFVITSKERYKQQIDHVTKGNQQNIPHCKSVSTSPQVLLQISELQQPTINLSSATKNQMRT